uniref:Uncharacterized protein n=1 Tax=Oxyrrhis marina TaxID=2969 RepID=A0A7S4LQD2_OXYMA
MADAEVLKSEQEICSLLYLWRYTDPCPDCGVRVQRTFDSSGCPRVRCPVPGCWRIFYCATVVTEDRRLEGTISSCLADAPLEELKLDDDSLGDGEHEVSRPAETFAQQSDVDPEYMAAYTAALSTARKPRQKRIEVPELQSTKPKVPGTAKQIFEFTAMQQLYAFEEEPSYPEVLQLAAGDLSGEYQLAGEYNGRPWWAREPFSAVYWSYGRRCGKPTWHLGFGTLPPFRGALELEPTPFGVPLAPTTGPWLESAILNLEFSEDLSPYEKSGPRGYRFAKNFGLSALGLRFRDKGLAAYLVTERIGAGAVYIDEGGSHPDRLRLADGEFERLMPCLKPPWDDQTGVYIPRTHEGTPTLVPAADVGEAEPTGDEQALVGNLPEIPMQAAEDGDAVAWWQPWSNHVIVALPVGEFWTISGLQIARMRKQIHMKPLDDLFVAREYQGHPTLVPC